MFLTWVVGRGTGSKWGCVDTRGVKECSSAWRRHRRNLFRKSLVCARRGWLIRQSYDSGAKRGLTPNGKKMGEADETKITGTILNVKSSLRGESNAVALRTEDFPKSRRKKMGKRVEYGKQLNRKWLGGLGYSKRTGSRGLGTRWGG